MNPPTGTIYTKTYHGKEGSRFIPGQHLEYPFALVLNAIGIVVVLALLPAIDYRLGVIVCGATTGWVMTSL